MDSVDITMNWQSALPTLLMVYQHAETKEGRDEAFAQLKWMAFLADQTGKQLEIEVYAMSGDQIANTADDVVYYDILVRFEGEDPLDAAKRELLEEGAYEAENFELWYSFQPLNKLVI